MALKAKKEAVKLPEQSEEVAVQKEASRSAASESVDILRGNNYIRSFSLEVHGEDFAKLAAEFVSGYPARHYEIVDSSAIPSVVVLYREKEDGEKPLKDQRLDSPIINKSKKFTDKNEAISFNILIQGRTGTAGSIVANRKA